MRQIWFVYFLSTLVLLVFSSCQKENDTTDSPPSLSVSAVGFSDLNTIKIGAGTAVTFSIQGKKGSQSLSTLSIFQNGVPVQASRLKFNGQSVTSNPVAVDPETFTASFEIISLGTAGTEKLDIVLSDQVGLKDSRSVTLTTEITGPVLLEPSTDITAIRGPGSLFGMVLKVQKGSADLATITFLVNGVAPVDLTGFYFGQNQSPIQAHIIPLSGLDVQGLNKEIYIKVPATIGTYAYTIKITDKNGREVSRKFLITAGSATLSLTGILANAAGGSTVGGLDLDSGASTSILNTNPTSVTAEIRDEGLVNPPSDKTWRQQISGMNGAEIRLLIPGSNNLPSSFTQESILFKEEILSLWEKGIVLTEKSADGIRLVSPKIKTGDLFIVKSGEKYYLTKVSDIKLTAADDKDQIIFQVKF